MAAMETVDVDDLPTGSTVAKVLGVTPDGSTVGRLLAGFTADLLATSGVAAAFGAGVTVLQAGAGAYARSLNDYVADHVSIMDYIPASEHAAIRSYTSTYDCLSAFGAAWDARGDKGLFIPNGGYRLSASWVLDRISATPGEVEGESTFGVRLLPDNGITAIRLTGSQPYSSLSLRKFWIRHALDHTSGGGIHCADTVQVHNCSWENIEIDAPGVPLYVGNHFSHAMKRVTCRSLRDCFVLKGGNTVRLDNCYGSYWAERGGTAVDGAAAFRIAGAASLDGCNGVDGLDYWAVIGSLIGDAYFNANVYPQISITGNSNLEGWKKAGIKGLAPGILNVMFNGFQYTDASTPFDAWIQLAGADSTLLSGNKFNSAGGAQTYGGTSSRVASTGTPNLVMINQGDIYQYFEIGNSSLYPVTAISPTISRQDTSVINIKAKLGVSGNAIPTPAVGDMAWGVEFYSAPRGVGSGPMAYENAKWHSMVRDKLTLDYQLSANTTIDARYLDGRRITNGGASGTITATLPTATVGDYAFFCRNIAQTFLIKPNASEIIGTGGAGKYLELGSLGAAVELRCVYAGVWMVTGQQGTVTYEP
jgi:hypothetical protein